MTWRRKTDALHCNECRLISFVCSGIGWTIPNTKFMYSAHFALYMNLDYNTNLRESRKPRHNNNGTGYIVQLVTLCNWLHCATGYIVQLVTLCNWLPAMRL
jgi:hypothetical protein